MRRSKPEVWPVIHVLSSRLALSAAELAAKHQCAGVFLISMDGYDNRIDPIAEDIRQRIPELSIGVNYLTMPADRALRRSLEHGYQATWTDDAGLHSTGVSDPAPACRALLQQHPDHPFFGAVDFKGQRGDADPGRAAQFALEYGMIPTTSGSRTGVAPPAQKLSSIRTAIGSAAPFAVASGVTPENVGELGVFVSHILISTGISADFHSFSEVKLAALMVNLSDPLSVSA